VVNEGAVEPDGHYTSSPLLPVERVLHLSAGIFEVGIRGLLTTGR
jgi:hypothetical protein